MSNVHSVIGLGYGDEGKGIVVDYLCSQYNPSETIVIRHSGGHQVGHTVKLGEIIHEFRHFGSGTLSGVPTYWSKRCTVSPQMFRVERDVLLMKGIIPRLFVNTMCPVVTPYDIAYNRALNISRGVKDSVGVGFAATLKRHELLPLYVMDLYYKYPLTNKLKSIEKYYLNLTDDLGIKIAYRNELKYLHTQLNGISFVEDCQYFVDNTMTFKNDNSVIDQDWNNFIFEGNQGILLDKNHGFYPYVTYGTTTNATLPDWVNKDKLKCWYVTRAYSTKHGDGPFPNECELDLYNVECESNHENPYQGKFRTAPLDINLLQYALYADEQYIGKAQRNIVVTCMDQIKKHQYIFNGKNHETDNFSNHLFPFLHHKIYINTSPESKTIVAL